MEYELVILAKRIGEDWAHKILKLSINLFDSKEINKKEVLIDTIVQEKIITFPTDSATQEDKRRLLENIGEGSSI